MSKKLLWRTTSSGPEQTERLGEALGPRLRGGECLELISDLGGGKTTFVRGLARGVGSPDTVSSPSFTLSNEYRGGSVLLYHFDFYRLNEPGIMRQELKELVTDTEAVTVVEWADIVEDVLPPDTVTITMSATGETSREIACAYPETRAYLFEGLA
ncbi:MAG TPA: tRNA (adenosine(37)-N6)-threonylcarbamoyltransferase complex ATPase subunit type 1 TsaE [Candidatus Saccharimonadales bacterium]|nr:tRNA (adenosine(37)-N6)-threonylcarbamoyltransferase complex ATPase subunit type 1 TsaE [Candidatus Saccharimonadales bacterium]